MKNPIVTIKIKDKGTIKLELYKDKAKNTVNNFLSLIDDKFYDGLIFHRVINGFMIQGGCPNGNGMGNASYNIKGEFSQNNCPNDLVHNRGVISMARSGMPDSASSQFFIMHEESPHLDGQYAAFGKVIEGMDVVDLIADSKVDASDKPIDDIVIEKISFELFGDKLEEVEKI